MQKGEARKLPPQDRDRERWRQAEGLVRKLASATLDYRRGKRLRRRPSASSPPPTSDNDSGSGTVGDRPEAVPLLSTRPVKVAPVAFGPMTSAANVNPAAFATKSATESDPVATLTVKSSGP